MCLVGRFTLLNQSVCYKAVLYVLEAQMDDNVCLLLLSEKRTYNGLPDLMTKVAHDEMNRMDDDIAECKVVYMPQVKLPFFCLKLYDVMW